MTSPIPPRGLIIMAHGSRRDSANTEFFDFVDAVASSATDRYLETRPALLEQAPPTLLQACQSLRDDIKEIDVYPLFFNRGKHVEKDIPAQVAEVMEQMPHRRVHLLPYFGSNGLLPQLTLAHIDLLRLEGESQQEG